ncbi:autotransporter outer membrane beta-barrel domain-containing protein [Microbulbifer halophilus]|uniref:Autotransporter outer membrane beta-barrel domain-containing protein n=2 Tax=Microbulbifer halophilus TaxID=453963 RepID=A0ABW5E943_9GAMM|nr:autotransporter domain-containing protein [Microbulbifer halophilus]MCW8125092.1 autotransporter domain-containing protein [Microbulbifer halophilus]
MGFPVRSIAAAVALAAVSSAQADNFTPDLYDNIVVFGDSLSDGGNAGIFTSSDPDGILPMQPAIEFTAQSFGVSPLLPSCSGLGPASGGAIPCAPAAGTAEQQLQQIAGSVLANGSNWAVGGNRAADVLLDVVGPQRFRELAPNTTVADHNTLTTVLPDSSRCGADGVCDPSAGESPYPSPADVALATAAFDDPAALQALVDDPGNSITLTGVPFATGQGYLTQNRVDRDSLYYLNGGGNDIIAGVLAGTVSPGSMERSAGFLATAAAALRSAGARFVAVSNAPRVGNTPLMNDLGPAAVSAGNTGTTLFNESLRRQLNRVGNVLILDTEGLGALALDRPGLFGFADIDQAATCYAAGECANPDPVYSESGSAPDSDQLFFNDGVHPTLAAGELLGDYYYSVLAAPVGFAILPDLGYENTRSHQSNIDHHLVAQRFRDPTTTVFFGAAWSRNDLGQGPAPGERGDSWDGFFGFSFAATDDFEWALALSYAGSEYQPEDLWLQADSWNLSGLARWDNERFFVDGGVTYSDIDYYEVDRRIQLGPHFSRRITGDTDGEAVSLFARAGYDTAPALPCQLGPFVSAAWTDVSASGFREDTHGDLTYVGSNGRNLDPIGLRVHHQSREYWRYRAGFFYNAPENAEWRWFGEVWFEANDGDETDTVGIGLKSIRGNSARMAAYDSRNAGFFQNGAGALVGLNLTDKFQVSGNIQVGADDTVGGLNLNYRF